MPSNTPKPVELPRNEENASPICKAAFILDQICNSYQEPKQASVDPMKRWIAMAVDEECFPLLAKRSMQEAGLSAKLPQSTSMRSGPMQSFRLENDTVWKGVVAAQGRFARGSGAKDQSKGYPAEASQPMCMPTSNSHAAKKSRASKGSTAVARFPKGIQPPDLQNQRDTPQHRKHNI